MAFGESRAQGVTRGRNFFHEDLGIALTAPRAGTSRTRRRPSPWSTAAGDAGLIVRLVPPQAGSTHDEIIRNLVKPTEGRTEQRTIHGLAATQFAGARRNDQGQTQAVRVLLVSGPGKRNYLLQPRRHATPRRCSAPRRRWPRPRPRSARSAPPSAPRRGPGC